MSESIRNRIKGHRRVRAGDQVPHEWNYRLHPDEQRGALQALYREVGFARSLLAYELPDGRLKLIDGNFGVAGACRPSENQDDANHSFACSTWTWEGHQL